MYISHAYSKLYVILLRLFVGIGLAHICNALGYKCVIYMPDTQSQVLHMCVVFVLICMYMHTYTIAFLM